MTKLTRTEEQAVYEAMAGYELQPGQALLLGPRSVAILSGRETHRGGALPDKLVLERRDWWLGGDDSGVRARRNR